jgi:hypothetical protein
VTLCAEDQVEVDLLLDTAPELVLERAEFEDDDALLVPTPPTDTLTRGGETFNSPWGQGVDPATKPFKPECMSTRPGQGGAARWYPASYSRRKKIKVHLRFREVVATARSYTFENLQIEPTAYAGILEFTDSRSEPLLDNGILDRTLVARVPLPDRIDRLQTTLRISATASGQPVRVTPAQCTVEVYVTWNTPTGQAKIHAETNSPIAFPEDGPVQSITEQRLEWAVAAAKGAPDEATAVRRISSWLQGHGIHYTGGRRYPAGNVTDNTTEITTASGNPPDLHHFLWFALNVPRTAECQDLAAALRLGCRILGIGGTMPVTLLYPWPPWDASGQRRDLSKPGAVWQGALAQYRDTEGSANCMFFSLIRRDGTCAANFHEGVLLWRQSPDTAAMLVAVGERICEGEPSDDRNASQFFEVADNPGRGRFALGLALNSSSLRHPPFFFMSSHPQQTLFRFEYDVDTFQRGDDRKMRAGILPPV